MKMERKDIIKGIVITIEIYLLYKILSKLDNINNRLFQINMDNLRY
jgi:hypothetical protein